jgi:hypothetical protein
VTAENSILTSNSRASVCSPGYSGVRTRTLLCSFGHLPITHSKGREFALTSNTSMAFDQPASRGFSSIFNSCSQAALSASSSELSAPHSRFGGDHVLLKMVPGLHFRGVTKLRLCNDN